MTMRLRSEVSLDIDSNRKLWLTTVADGVEVEDVEKVTESMTHAMLSQASEAANLVAESQQEVRMPPTFGED